MNYRQILTEALMQRDGNRCWLCGKPFAVQDAVHFDHAVAKSNGGPDTFANLQLVHAFCNISAGRKPHQKGYRVLKAGIFVSSDDMRLRIRETLVQTGGDKGKTAALLGISLRTLYRRLE